MVFQVLILLATDLRETFEKVPEGGDLMVLRSFGRRCLETLSDRVKSPSRGSLLRQHRVASSAGLRRRRRSVGASAVPVA